jgi:ABC-type transport system involved in multi-copper enzyme maturation permease subunit
MLKDSATAAVNGERRVAADFRMSEVSAGQMSARSRPLQRILVIAWNTFRESVRDRVLYNLVLFVLILVCASVLVSDIAIAYETKFTADLGMSAMVVFGALIAIFVGVGLVYKEIDRRTIYNLLSKPVHRHEFILGKYLGLCLTLLVNTMVMLIATELAMLYVSERWMPIHRAVLSAGYLIYLELALITAVALMFSTFTTPMLAALFSFSVYVAGHFSKDLLKMADLSGSVIAHAILRTLYYLLPNLSNFSYISEASHAKIVPLKMASAATAYALVYVSVLLAASILIFQKRGFK